MKDFIKFSVVYVSKLSTLLSTINANKILLINQLMNHTDWMNKNPKKLVTHYTNITNTVNKSIISPEIKKKQSCHQGNLFSHEPVI